MLHGQNGIRMERGTFSSSTLSQLKYFEAKLVIILFPVLTNTMKDAKKKWWERGKSEKEYFKNIIDTEFEQILFYYSGLWRLFKVSF